MRQIAQYITFGKHIYAVNASGAVCGRLYTEDELRHVRDIKRPYNPTSSVTDGYKPKITWKGGD